MKLLSMLFILLSVQAQATSTLSCQWQKSSNHARGFYRPAIFEFELTNSQLIIIEDTFLFRSYAPCWSGGFSSCAFGFTYDTSSDWSIEKQTQNEFTLSAPGFYWSAELELSFQKAPQVLSKNEKTTLLMSGDDGDGVWFRNEKFNCTKI